MADLLDAETVARYLGLEDDPERRETLNELIDAAQAAIERIANRSLSVASQATEYYSASGAWFYTDRAPIVTINALADSVQDAAREIDLTDVITDSNDGGRNYRAGRVELWKNESTFAGGTLNVRIDYVAGWTKDTLPADLRQAWIELVAFWYNNPQRVGIVSAAQGGENISWQQRDVPIELYRVFRSYRLAGENG